MSVDRQTDNAEIYHRGYAGSDPYAHGPAHTGISWRTAAALVCVVVLVAAIAVANLVDVAKVIYRPGPVYDTLGARDGQEVVSIDGLTTYPTSGTLDFTTITLHGDPERPISAWEWLLAELDPAADVVDRSQVYPEEVTTKQVQEQNAALMKDSQEGAAVVALRAQGVEVPEHIKVAQILVDAPASGVLEVNDEILTVGGEKPKTPDDIRDRLQDYEAGDTVEFTVLREGEEIELSVPTGEDTVPLPEGGSELRTVIGVYLASDFELPYEVTIDAGNVGGPSAGLMFSLAVYDKISPGELTGGTEFAGTGTINSAGEVGPIGGIKQKMIGAQRSGADYFLAPAPNCEEVVGNVPDGLTVAKVSTFEGALSVVEQVAAGTTAGLPTC